MDATWNTPQSLHNSSSGESFLVVVLGCAGAISVVDEDAIGVDEAGAISVVDKDAIGVDEADAISVVDEDSTPELIAGARVKGRKTPHLLR